ncbi:MAG: exodeoxyribonuclease VII large subunit [Muribaculaceae bacterium]|nr:exodeoxyribonuclease VII large subunit [Muribaculaceae bacterium]
MTETLTLHQFTSLISSHVNAAPQLTGRWVTVEIARIGMSGPHCYCELIEKNAKGDTVARIRGTIWGNVWRRLAGKFFAATGTPIAAGMKVLLNMSASHNPAYGLSANIHDIDPTYTLGDAERRRREILEGLKREGIIDSNKQLPLKPNTQKIAVISAASAAGYGDFINQLDNSGFAFYPLLYPAAMQGVKTAPSVMEALDRVEMAVDFWDAVVIIRGGGATDDLNSFDDPDLARRIALFPLPVIVGIGHERDRTVLDEIAYTRCKTPTAVAAFLIERLQACERYAETLAKKATDYCTLSLSGERQRIERLASVIPLLAPRRIDTEKHRLDNLKSSLQQLTSSVTRHASEQLTRLGSKIEATAISALTLPKERLNMLPDIILKAAETRIKFENERLQSRSQLISVLSPDATLKRGYSITRFNGKAIRSVSSLPSGATITTTLADGELTSTITI